MIRDESRSSKVLVAAASGVMRARRQAAWDELGQIQHKLSNTSLALHKNALYMHHYRRTLLGMGAVDSSSAILPSTPADLQRLLLHPEHFPRGFQSSPLLQAPVATSTQTQSSPWEGSEFKVPLP